MRLTVRHVTTPCTSCVAENVKHGLQSRGTRPYQSLSGQTHAVGARQPGYRQQRSGANGSDVKQPLAILRILVHENSLAFCCCQDFLTSLAFVCLTRMWLGVDYLFHLEFVEAYFNMQVKIFHPIWRDFGHYLFTWSLCLFLSSPARNSHFLYAGILDNVSWVSHTLLIKKFFFLFCSSD